jgi:hypothetical protein
VLFQDSQNLGSQGSLDMYTLHEVNTKLLRKSSIKILVAKGRGLNSEQMVHRIVLLYSMLNAAVCCSQVPNQEAGKQHLCLARFSGTCMVRLHRTLVHVVLHASPRPTTARGKLVVGDSSAEAQLC